METPQNRSICDEDLPNDVETLQLLVGDLNRRLQNALHVIESQKLTTANSVRAAAAAKADLHKVAFELNLERNKSETQNRRKMKNDEFERYEREKKRSEKMHEELRLAMIDHKISNIKKEPVKLIKMRKQLDKLEKIQGSQKQLLHHLSIQEKMIEELSTLAQQDDLEGCRNLIRRGVNVNEVDSAGFLPLHYACSTGSVAVAQLLLEFGSDATSYLTGVSPLVLAAEGGHHEVIFKLVAFNSSVEDTGNAKTPPIVAAAKKCHLRAIEALISLGANINAADVDGNTALHAASQHDKPVPVIRCLLLNGADSKAVNTKGLTPVQVALNCLNIPAMEVLGGRDGGGYVSVGGEDPVMTGSGYVEMDPLIPVRGNGGSATVRPGQYDPNMSGLNSASVDADNLMDRVGENQQESSVFSEVTNSVILPPR